MLLLRGVVAFRTTHSLPVFQLGQVRVIVRSALVIHLIFLDTLARVGTVEVAGHGIITGNSGGRVLLVEHD